MISVNQMNAKAKSSTTTLFPTFDAEWWEGYTAESNSVYDDYFTRKYRSFRLRGSYEETEAQALTRFKSEVLGIFNILKYQLDNLWLSYAVEDEEPYSDIDLEIKTDKDTGYTKGARTDTGTSTTGAQLGTTTDKVAPFDSNVFNESGERSVNMGSRSDGTSLTSGEQIDSGTEDTTITTKGSKGNKYDAAMKHDRFWKAQGFYEYLFQRISAELLKVGDC